MYKSLGQAFKEACREKKKGITFIKGKNEEKYISYEELYKIAISYLACFQRNGLKPQDELVFQIDDVEVYVYTFWACIIGGIIPVPLGVALNKEQKSKLYNVFEVLEKPYLIISKAMSEKTKLFYSENSEMQKKTLFLEELELSEQCTATEFEPNEEDLAFILFSSGSTGDPKGVMTTHKSIVLSAENFADYLCVDAQKDSFLGWMPLTHVAGLTVSHIAPLLAGVNQFFIDTPVFLNNPNIWFDKASEHKATIIASPNFGLRLLMDRLDMTAAESWDLSSVRVLLTGAEPVNYDVAAEFSQRMQNYGLAHNTISPAYGLSETTSFLSISMNKLHKIYLDRQYLSVGDIISEVDEASENGVCFVSNGEALNSFEVRITDNDNNELGHNKVGRIQAKGLEICNGYYKNKEATNQMIKPGNWMDTGDLGVIFKGNLYITGRAKDIIFVNGKNFYPSDIEKVAEGVDGINEGMIATCGIPDKVLQKDIIVAFVINKGKLEDFASLADNLKKHVSIVMGLDIKEVVPVSEFPVTRSGKIQRYKLGEMYCSGFYNSTLNELSALMNEVAVTKEIRLPENNIEEEILKVWQEVLERKDISTDESFFVIGGNSIKAVQTVTKLSVNFEIELNDIFQNQTISSLARKITYKKGNLEEIISEYKKIINSASYNRISLSEDFRNQSREYKNLINDNCLDRDLEAREQYKNILLTGATGYLGVYLLRDLLVGTDTNVYTLVRGKTIEDSQRRLLQKMEFYFGSDLYDKYKHRIYLLQGDLTEDNFGLDSDIYNDISLKIDCIINTAANVKHYGVYEDFYNINVQGTKRVVDFALKNKLKDVNHFSTIGVASGALKNPGTILFTEYHGDIGQKYKSHYISTKLDSEKIILEARKQGIKANIFRVGNITFDSKSGKFQENVDNNAFYTVIMSLSKIGVFPEMNNNNIDFSFVDSVSQAIMLLFDRKYLKNRVYHIANSYHTSIFDIARLFKKHGLPIDIKAVNEFMDFIMNSYQSEKMTQYIENLLVHSSTMYSSGDTKYIFANKKTEMLLEKLGFIWPKFNETTSKYMLDYCREINYI